MPETMQRTGQVRVGVDVGGSFTDLVLDDRRGGGQRVVVHKVPSTPHDQSIAVVDGVLGLCRRADVAPSDIDVLFHGTTVATNMVIERKGAEVGMITTRGFHDILHMARHKRPHNFSLQFEMTYLSPCGGGYGNPLERDPRKVLDDILDGYITPAHAAEAYGVVVAAVDDGYGWALDTAAPIALRAEVFGGAARQNDPLDMLPNQRATSCTR